MKQQKPKHLVAIIIAMLFSFSAFSQDGYIYPYNAKACQFSTNDSMVFAVTSTVVDAVRYTFKYRLDGSSPLTITTDSLATQVKLPINTSTITTHIYILDSIKADTGKYMASTYPVAWTTRNVEIGTASSYTGTVNINTCSDRLPFNWGDKLVTGSGTYSTILKNSYQCDSFATITFAFNYSDTITSKDSVCFSQFPYLKFGINYNNVGTYYQRTLNDNASYFSFPDTATMNIQIVNLYKYLYAHNPLTMNLINGSGHANFGQKAFDIVNDLMGNDMVVNSQGYGWFNTYYQYTGTQVSTNNAYPDVARRRYYEMLYIIKGIIESIDKLNYSTTNKESIKGQCYGLRAYCYYYLINYYQQTYFGNTTLRGLPIIKENVTTLNNSFGTVQDIYNLMISDLTQAENLLTGKTFADKTAFSIYAVYGFRARVALLMNNWSSAAYYANAAYTSMGATTLMTTTQYKQGFNSITNPEWIWGSYIDSTNATVYASFFSHMDANVYGYAQLGGQKKITKALYDQIASLDVRKQVFKTPGTGTTKEPEYCQTKFHLANPSKWVGDYLYMRTAEMYLIEAEAKARLGNYVSARAVLETLVKSRYPTYSAASFSGAALISEILLQRRIELWGEGFSLIDLKRTNAGLNRPTGAGNHGSPNLDPVVYSLPAGSQQMLWVTPSRDSGFVIPCEKVQKLIITKRIIKENINVSVCNSSLPYRWNGMDYTNNGTYFYFTTTSDNSCDSVAILNLVINKLIPILNNINLKNCNSITYKTKVYTASTIVRDTVKSYQGCDSIYNVATLTITKVTPTTSTVTLYGCNNIIYKGNSYITTTIVRDTVKSYQGCDSIYNVANINILTPANCAGYLVLDADTSFGLVDTLNVRVRIKDGVNIFSTYAYLNFDNTVLKLVNSKPGTYLGSQIINQSPVVTGGKIDFGLTQTFGQTGASGDGIVYEFKFLVKAAPPVMTFINKTELYFNLTNLSIYNALGLQPSSFNYLSSLKDTSICKVLVWPGDLNSDKKVSVADLLPIGYFYGLNGPARAGGNLSWTAQPAVLWGSDMTTQSSSAYRVFADGNADGTISLADQAAIGFNLSKSHAKQITQAIAIAPQKSFPTNMPAINVDIPDTLIPKASLPLTQTINITVGSSSYSINNLYGVAFEIYFNPACVNTAAISTNYTSSIFGTQNVDYTKLEDYSEITTGKLSIALTRFNTTSIVGNGGKVLSINLPFLATAPVGWFKVTAIPLGCNDNLGNTISVTGSENSLRIAAADLLISGRCITPLSKSIKKVNCNLSGIGILASDILGGYEFSSGISANANYTLSPTKNNDISKANGISATDVLLTQRHILNTSKLNSAYKLIAADVNGDKNINATDVLRIKRLILGTDTTFTKGSGANKVDRLWEFVDSAYQFPDTTNPFPFKDSIVFTNLTSSKINQTFIGVKLGDVNYDWNAALSRGVAVNNLQLVYNVISTKEKSTQTDFSGTNLRNEELLIPITVNNFKNLAAMQYTLHFDNSKYEFVGIENNKLGIDFNEKQANTTGNIAMLWTDKNGQAKTLEDGSELFTLVLKPVNNPLSIDNSLLTITNDIAEVEAWDNDFKKHNIVLTQKVSAKDQEPKTKDQLVIYPNPTNGIVNIECANAKQVVMTDCLGRRIKEYNNPTQLLTFNCKLLTKGIYIVQVTMKDGTIKSEKLVVE